jgi:hypothetical protein
MQNIEQLRAMIKSIPATPEGNRQIAMMANDPDPMKRMLAGIEANERARMRAQRQAEQGQQQQGRRPVVQEKMDEMMQAGIGGLDMNEDMYGQGMAAGGIVAFDQGGGVNYEDPLAQFSGLDAEGMSADQVRFEALMEQRRLKEARDRFNFLKNAAPEAAAAMLKNNPALADRPPVAAPTNAAPNAKPVAKPNAKPNAKPPAPAANPNQPPEKDPFSLMQEYLRGDAAERAAARKDAKNMALLETGLAMLGGDSPYASVNIGRAGAQGARGYGEKIAGLRKEERDVGKSLADLELKKYELGQAKELGQLQRQTQKDVANIYAAARGDAGDKNRAGIIKAVTASVDKRLGLDPNFLKIKDPAERARTRAKEIQQELSLYGAEGSAAPSFMGSLEKQPDGSFTYNPRS